MTNETTTPSSNTPEQWRSLADYDRTPLERAQLANQRTEGPTDLEIGPLERRKFLSILGATGAVAGTLSLEGCIRKPVEKILPYTTRPEDLIPGKPRFFRTAMNIGPAVLGLHVESQDGRPTKVEGNADHPMSLGGAHSWAQASVLDLYDQDRSRTPTFKGATATWAEAKAAIAAAFAPQRGKGAGLGLLIDARPSPTLHRLVGEFKKSYPEARVFRWDPTDGRNGRDGLALAGVRNGRAWYDLEKADVVVALDSDFMLTDGDSVRNARLFVNRRRAGAEQGAMNRLYAVETTFSVTGAFADNRLRVPSSHTGELLRGLAAKLLGTKAPPGVRAAIENRQSRGAGIVYTDKFRKWIDAVAADLQAAPGKSVIVVGERQPAWVHGLALLVNDALGALGKVAFVTPEPSAPGIGTVEELGKALAAGQLQSLVMLGGNPAYDAPADLDLANALKRLPLTIHTSRSVDETSSLATWHLPSSHFLEAWGDLQASDGTVSIQQPLIAPLFDTLSELEVLALTLGLPAEQATGHALVQATILGGAADQNAWRRAVHDGQAAFRKVKPAENTFDWGGLEKAMAAAPDPTVPSSGALDVAFIVDASSCDGRFANNAWLQELPDPMSKLTWDNAAYLSPSTADGLGLKDGALVTLTLGGRKLELPIWRLPGTADNVAVLPLGYGRRQGGHILEGAGFDTYTLRTTASLWSASGASLADTGRTYALASTQEHGTMIEPFTGKTRPIVREATVEAYRQTPEFVEKVEMLKEDHMFHLWDPPNPTDGHQWGMSIDLNSCTGCNACTIACQSENNIAVVGKERVLNGREMHWIRLDRYFTGDQNDPQAVVQPLPCQQCEMAPCENVCPVGATAHSPEGLNDMAYNRCIGTRYCANNCPYKVRRFNFFNYQKENLTTSPLWKMQKNPDVTVRFRGVVEKCTYCVQRINEAKIEAKRDGHSLVSDGKIKTACEQTCPTGAIVFGNVADPASAVSKQKAIPRDYALLRELNVRPRTTYLAKLRNPNPALV